MGKKLSKIKLKKQKELECQLKCRTALEKAKLESKKSDLGSTKRLGIGPDAGVAMWARSTADSIPP